MQRNPCIVRAAQPHPCAWRWVNESLEEGEFLWQQRDNALVAADYDLCDVSRCCEERLLGCVDGLLVAGDTAIEPLLREAAQGDDQSRASVAALALAEGSEAAWECLTATLVAAKDEQIPALRRGIELCRQPNVVSRLQEATKDAGAALLACYLDTCGFCRCRVVPELGALASYPHPHVQRAAFFAARLVGRSLAEPIVDAGIGGCGPARDLAIESGLVLGLPIASEACADALGKPTEVTPALLLLAALLGARHQQRLLDALGRDELLPSALWALGFAGTRDAADASVDVMQSGRAVSLAGEAFSFITGLDFEAQGLCEREPTATSVDDADADLAPHPEDALARPKVAVVSKWWHQNRARFAPDQRYLDGRPLDRASLLDALTHAKMRRRHALALALAIHTRGELQINTRAWCRDQRNALRALGTTS